jgi:hypothetical protein
MAGALRATDLRGILVLSFAFHVATERVDL